MGYTKNYEAFVDRGGRDRPLAKLTPRLQPRSRAGISRAVGVSTTATFSGTGVNPSGKTEAPDRHDPRTASAALVTRLPLLSASKRRHG
jgi:hypothetical protein